jgi:hypothetical protein
MFVDPIFHHDKENNLSKSANYTTSQLLSLAKLTNSKVFIILGLDVLFVIAVT